MAEQSFLTSAAGDVIDETENFDGDTPEGGEEPISDELEKAFENLVFNKVCQRDLLARRMEVRDAW